MKRSEDDDHPAKQAGETLQGLSLIPLLANHGEGWGKKGHSEEHKVHCLGGVGAGEEKADGRPCIGALGDVLGVANNGARSLGVASVVVADTERTSGAGLNDLPCVMSWPSLECWGLSGLVLLSPEAWPVCCRGAGWSSLTGSRRHRSWRGSLLRSEESLCCGASSLSSLTSSRKSSATRALETRLTS